MTMPNPYLDLYRKFYKGEITRQQLDEQVAKMKSLGVKPKEPEKEKLSDEVFTAKTIFEGEII